MNEHTSEQTDRLTRRNVLRLSALAAGTAVIGTAAAGTAAAGVGDGRVGHYTLNNLQRKGKGREATRTLVRDASPHNNHGTWNGDETDPVVSGRVGNAFEFTGGDFVEVDFGDSDVVYEDWSVSGWIHLDDWSDTARKEWLSVAEDSTEDKPLDFVHEDGAIKHYRGSAAAEVMSYGVSEMSGWHHMAVTQERVDSENVRLTMYFDGSPVDSDEGSYENMQPSTKCYIGKLARDQTRQFYWEGRIDEVLLHNRVLSLTEIEALAARGGD